MKYSCICEESKEQSPRFFRRFCALLDENGNILQVDEDDMVICAYCGEEAEEVNEEESILKEGKYESAR